MTGPGAPRAASVFLTRLPARIIRAGLWCCALLAAQAQAAPVPVSPQTVSPAAPPPTAQPGHKVPAGQPVATAYPALSADDELIFEIQTQHREMADTITAHGLRGGVYLPFGDLARFLDLPITISDDGHYASGWFLSPTRTLSINLRAGTITLAGKETALRKTDFAAYEGELYVKAERIGEILPITVLTDLRAQAVTIKTLEPFPFEERLARESAREKLANVGNKGHQQVYPRETTPWRAIDVPITDVELRTLGGDGDRTHAEADIRSSGDLAFLTARLYAGLSSASGLTAARAQLGRRDPDLALLGPLHASEFQLGDVASEALPLGLRGVAGRGVFVTNEPLERASVFDTMDFRGDLPSGYEVEIYRNDALVGSTREAVNGQYQFLKVPVEFGLNVFRLVFYGPQGQRREDIRRVSVGDGRLARGALVYTLSAVQKDSTLIGISTPGALASIDQGAWRQSAQVQYGVTAGLTVVASGALYQSGADGTALTHHWLGTLGLRTGIGGFATRLDGALASGGGRALEIGLGGRLLGASLVVAHARYGGGFIDETRSPSSLPLTTMTTVNLSRTLRLGLRSIPLSLDWQHLAFANGQITDTAAFRQSFTAGRLIANNTLNFAMAAAPGSPASHQLSGNFDLSSFAGSRTQFRAGGAYDVAPHARLSALNVEIDHTFNPETALRIALSHAFSNNQTTLGLSATRKFGPIALSFDTTIGVPQRSFAFALRAGFAFGRNPMTGRPFIARPGLSGSGAVALRAFADANGNGRFDPGEQVVGKTTFFTGTQSITAGDAGTALLGGIGDGNRAAVRIDAATLPDIAQAPVRAGVEIVPRAGRIHQIDFAIQQLSDIEGTAQFADGKGRHGVAGLMLYLIDAQGHRAARVRSENDGFVLFEQIHPGDYTLAIAPDQARNLKIRLIDGGKVHVGTNGKTVRVHLTVGPE